MCVQKNVQNLWREYRFLKLKKIIFFEAKAYHFSKYQFTLVNINQFSKLESFSKNERVDNLLIGKINGLSEILIKLVHKEWKSLNKHNKVDPNFISI